MISLRTRSPLAFTLLFLGTISHVAAAPEGKAEDPARTPPAGVATLAAQVAELQKQVAELRGLQTPRIVAAGTATYRRPELQDNTTIARVKLNADVAAKLGKDYIVLLTNRYPTGGYPYFSVYWKPSKDGFDISLVDIELNGSTASYSNKNKIYLIDWIVVFDPSAARNRDEDGPVPTRNTDVLLSVRVPENATVWINGDEATQTGSRREFTSSGHTPGKTYTYTIRARWEEGGKTVDRTQKVPVQGGERRVIDFLAPAK
jgi:uncharacterized protein (TIGR03000 family)